MTNSTITKQDSTNAEAAAPSPQGAKQESATKDRTLTRVIPFVLATELCERLAFYGLTGSLTVFLAGNLGRDKAAATEMTSVFTAVTYLTPLLGGYVADAKLGRYKTILLFSLLYLVGMVMCVVGSIPSYNSAPLFLAGLLGFVALGAGGIKPNVVVLGADQFPEPAAHASQEELAAHTATKTTYFNYFYWTINIGPSTFCRTLFQIERTALHNYGSDPHSC